MLQINIYNAKRTKNLEMNKNPWVIDIKNDRSP